jgi:hypothetical protein
MTRKNPVFDRVLFLLIGDDAAKNHDQDEDDESSGHDGLN